MQSALASIPLTIGLVGAAALSLWIAIREYRRERHSGLSEPAWPFEFSVYTLDYYVGPRLARFARVAQVAFYAPYFLMGAADSLFGEDNLGILMLTLLVSFFSAVVGAFVPIRCRLDEHGIRFHDQTFPWDTIRRWNVNDRRLQFVAARSTNRKLLFTAEIPLNGLCPSLRPWLDEQIAAHATDGVLVGADSH